MFNDISEDEEDNLSIVSSDSCRELLRAVPVAPYFAEMDGGLIHQVDEQVLCHGLDVARNGYYIKVASTTRLHADLIALHLCNDALCRGDPFIRTSASALTTDRDATDLILRKFLLSHSFMMLAM